MSELADSIFTGRMIGFSSEWKKVLVPSLDSFYKI